MIKYFTPKQLDHCTLNSKFQRAHIWMPSHLFTTIV